jgi:hypothetical protein
MASIIGHSEVEAFAEERVNLPAAKAKKHREQVKALRERLERKIDDDPNFGRMPTAARAHAGARSRWRAMRSPNPAAMARRHRGRAIPPPRRGEPPCMAPEILAPAMDLARQLFAGFRYRLS